MSSARWLGSEKSITIVPTYRYRKKFPDQIFSHREKMFPHDITWGAFTFAIEKFLSTGSFGAVNFTGGEPLLWPLLPQAIEHCHKNSIHTSLVTDLHKIPDTLPHTIKVNLTYFFQETETTQEKILENLTQLSDQKVRKKFHFFFQKNTAKKQIKTIFAIAKKHDAQDLYIAPQIEQEKIQAGKFSPEDFPGITLSPPLKSLWLYAAEAYQKNFDRSLPFNAPAPPKLFNFWEKLKLYARHDFCSSCRRCPTRNLLLNPDGCTLYPCSKLEIPAPIDTFFGFADFWEKNYKDKKSRIKLNQKGCPGIQKRINKIDEQKT
jgi:hypothetical protein